MELKLSFGEHLDALGFRKRISLYHLPSCVRVFVCVYVCDSRGSSLRRRRRRRAVVLLQLIFRQKPVNRQASVEAVGRRHPHTVCLYPHAWRVTGPIFILREWGRGLNCVAPFFGSATALAPPHMRSNGIKKRKLNITSQSIPSRTVGWQSSKQSTDRVEDVSLKDFEQRSILAPVVLSTKKGLIEAF